MTYGITSTGFTAKAATETLSDVSARMVATIDPALDVSYDSVAGQIARSVTPEIDDLWAALADLYAAFDPDRASGDALDALCALTGTSRLPAAATSVLLTCTVTTNAIPAGAVVSIVGHPEIRLYADAEIAPPASPGDVTGWFTAAETGPLFVAAGTATVIETAVTGWTAATNASDGITGRNIEDDATLRARRNLSLGAEGRGTVGALRAALLELGQCLILENTSDVTDSDGLLPHSVECVVYAPAVTDDAIAQTIANASVMGYRLQGSDYGTATLEDGSTVSVAFSRATVESPAVVLAVTGDVSSSAVASAVLARAATLTVGQDIISGALAAAAYGVPGLVRVTSCTVGGSATDYVIPQRSVAVVQSSDITVTVTPEAYP